MNKIVKFPTKLKASALTMDDGFDPVELMDSLIQWVMEIDNRQDAYNFIVALYNEGILYGHTAEGAVKLLGG